MNNSSSSKGQTGVVGRQTMPTESTPLISDYMHADCDVFECNTPPPSPCNSGRASGVIDGANAPDEEDVKRSAALDVIELRLLNRGSVARDHLASERTYLAYVRTSLGLSSAGVALMQFMYLGHSTRRYAGPIGALTIVTGLLVLYIGTKRFYLVQRKLITGHYPPSGLEMGLISFLLGGIVTATFGIILFTGG